MDWGYTLLLLLGVFMMIIGILNWKGHIASIHWYNRFKVIPEDAPKYGRAMGAGTMVIGLGMAVTAVLQMFLQLENLFYIAVAGIVVGLAIMLWAQFKYNKGII
ncbi:MAG: hypothetical protein ACOX6U_05590 [Oscillospiraceae bacterium]|jgi:hypothetical protein